jgi:hypothetical protein
VSEPAHAPAAPRPAAAVNHPRISPQMARLLLGAAGLALAAAQVTVVAKWEFA